jgi:preprotein translocase subunit YajC
VTGVGYRYELRRGDEVVATGHLNHEQSLEVGDRIQIGGQVGIVRTVEPLLGEGEVRLVVQLLADRG